MGKNLLAHRQMKWKCFILIALLQATCLIMLLARSNGETNSALSGFEEKLREKLFSLYWLSWWDGMMPGKEWKICSSLGHDLLHLSPKKNAIYYWTASSVFMARFFWGFCPKCLQDATIGILKESCLLQAYERRFPTCKLIPVVLACEITSDTTSPDESVRVTERRCKLNVDAPFLIKKVSFCHYITLN